MQAGVGRWVGAAACWLVAAADPLCRAQLDELGVAYSSSQIKLKASGVSLGSHKSIQCCITPSTSHSPPQDTCLTTGRAKTTDEHERDEILLRTRWSVWSNSLAGLTDMILNVLDCMHPTFANLQTMEHLRQSCMFTGWVGIGLGRARTLYVSKSGKTGSKDHF